MFISQYLPVDMGRPSPYIRSNEKTIYVSDLVKMRDLAESENVVDAVNGVYLNVESGLFEMPTKNLILSAEEIFLANQAWQTAVENKFSFYAAYDDKGSPVLFISKQFAKNRMIVNPFNMRTLVVTHPLLLTKLASMIDKRMSMSYAWDVFTLCHDLQTKKASYLTSLMVWRGKEDAYMAVNPLMTPMSEDLPCYSVDMLEEIKTLLHNHITETESFRIKGSEVIRTDLEKFPVLTIKHCKDILNTYGELLEKKSNYEPIIDMDFEVKLYYSTNHRYLVNADTFQCVRVTNESIRRMLDILQKRGKCDASDLRLAWEVAKSN